jgi:TRAP transporter TAXI family solute receptor
LNKTIPKMNANATATGASAANVALLKEGKADIIFVQNDAAYYALNDLEFFKGKAMKEIRGIACLYKETIQLVALSSSGIRSLSDLKGKRVSVGAAGSGVEINARHILSAAGLAYNDIRVHYLSFAEASANLKEGKIDAAFNTAGVPTAAIQDLAASTRITLVPIEGSAASALKAKYPFYVADRIPAGAYTGQSGDVSTVAAKSMLAVNANIDANLVYNFLVAIFSNRDRLAAAHARGADIKLATALEGMSIPLHPGAEMFYRDAR